VTLLDVFDVLFYHVVWPWHIDLLIFWSWQCLYTVPRMIPDPHTNFYYPMIIGYWVMNYWIWSHICYGEHSLRMRHAPCHVTYHRVAKNAPHFWNLWPKFIYSLCHFQGAGRRLSHAIGENIP